MKKPGRVLGIAILAVALALPAHYALIELSGEVAVVRTQTKMGTWKDTRLWIVDEGDVAWLHGGDSEWMRNLRANPGVDVIRDGKRQRYTATPVEGPHPRVHELLRAKYGIADMWVRLIGPDGPTTVAVKLERLY
jgi:hypothetical protein